ncbi:MAG: hypothetical protein L6R41_007968, partial [Letrouitia leprolyta]
MYEDTRGSHEKISQIQEGKTSLRCPIAQEFRQAKAHHPVLASTGCTRDFCQAGRAVHTDEPRIGENRAIEVVEQEAKGFLGELYREKFFDTEESFTDRLNAVLAEIRSGASEGKIRETRQRGIVGGSWLLEFAGYEMEDGTILGDPMSVALTKEIMKIGWEPPSPRSRWDLLPLVVMAEDDVPAMIEIPAPLKDLVHIRHPRYEKAFENLDLRWVAAPALTRLGFDIGGVQYTAAPFIGWFMDAEIGVRDLADTFRYNVLPDVVKALGLLDGKGEGVESLDDLPEYERLSALTQAQAELTYAVNWSYQQARVSMSDTLTASMKWCRYDDDFQAKNGFRLPADPYWLAPPQGSIVPVWHRGGAPNYQPKPMICKHVQDPLKAWEREKRVGFVCSMANTVAISQPKRPSLEVRSTSDDYYPTIRNEQPFPDTHLEDYPTILESTTIVEEQHSTQIHRQHNKLSISVCFCSAGNFAEKLAMKLHSRLTDMAENVPSVFVHSEVQPLNKVQSSTIKSNELILAVVSSTGQGEVPPNGSEFVKMCDKHSKEQLKQQSTSFRYAIYGNGDSRYSATYNGAAALIDQKFHLIGGLPITSGFYQGDTALHVTALQALSPWWAKLQPAIRDLAIDSPKLRRIHSDDINEKVHLIESFDLLAEAISRASFRAAELRNNFHTASVVGVTPSFRENYQGTYLVTLDIGDKSYKDLTSIQLLPINAPAKVRRALRALGVSASYRIALNLSDSENPTYTTFLTEHIDLESPFLNLDWLTALQSSSMSEISEEELKSLSSVKTLEYLHAHSILPTSNTLTTSILLALPPLHPRTYSIASSPSYPSQTPTSRPHNKHTNLFLLVKPLPAGRFSSTFLSTPPPTPLKYRLLPSSSTTPLLSLSPITPLLIVATGAGFAPVRSLLEYRISHPTHQYHNSGSITLFLGLKHADIPLISDTVNQAAAAGILGNMVLV